MNVYLVLSADAGIAGLTIEGVFGSRELAHEHKRSVAKAKSGGQDCDAIPLAEIPSLVEAELHSEIDAFATILDRDLPVEWAVWVETHEVAG